MSCFKIALKLRTPFEIFPYFNSLTEFRTLSKSLATAQPNPFLITSLEGERFLTGAADKWIGHNGHRYGNALGLNFK